jgi:hypothetical protein
VRIYVVSRHFGLSFAFIAIILIKKPSQNKKMISEKDIIDQLKQGRILLGPLGLRLSDLERRGMEGRVLDAIVSISWNQTQEQFAAEIKALSTPKIIREALYAVKATAPDMRMNPMIIVPYLDREALSELEREEVSGVDLCGNGVVIVPGKWFVERSGQPNQFPSSAAIKSIYRRKSSLVGRVFLVQPRYQRIGDVLKEVNRRNILATWQGRPITFGTISKVLKALEGDIIVGREGSSVRLLQADKLLDKLSGGYSAPGPSDSDSINWKIATTGTGLPSVNEILGNAFQGTIPAVVTGLSSVSMYAVMQAGETISIYCPDPEGWLANVPGSRADRFPTISLIRTDDASVYFDARKEKGLVWASPVQTYLELSSGDKRDQETALQVKDFIMRRLQEGAQ